jgi:hypothetical protein
MHTGGTKNTLIIQDHGRTADLLMRNRVDKELAVSELNPFSPSLGVCDVTTQVLWRKYRTSNVRDLFLTAMKHFSGLMAGDEVQVSSLLRPMLHSVQYQVGLKRPESSSCLICN